MASWPGRAPSTRPDARQIGALARRFNPLPRIELWLEAERDQLPLWLPVAIGAGIAVWLMLSWQEQWIAFLLAMIGMAAAATAVGRGGWLSRVLAIGALGAALGCGLIWWRAERVAAPVLARPAVVSIDAPIERVERLPARGIVRLTLRPGRVDLPPRIRVNVDASLLPDTIRPGARAMFRARLMAPAGAAVPGAYDFARVAWFQGLGATGRAFGPIVITDAPTAGEELRASLTRHIHARVPGSAGGVAAALVTGDRGAISVEDDEALRRAGLAHLLSVSGLHVTAVVGATMFAVLRLLSLFPALALRVRLPVVAALAAAVVAAFYTWLTGAEVPTVRSLIAALIVLAALAMGREAITLRLVAAGALIVLLLWPEAAASASFQLSFAAVTTIVALHEHSRISEWFAAREEARWRRMARGGASLLLTGLAIELALMPIGLFHFHKAGLYGAAANLVAIPLTTFVVMPAEALALTLDTVGLGAPAWWVAALSLEGLLALARAVAGAPGSVTALPTMPVAAFALSIAGGLWIALWRTRWRWFGAMPLAIGIGWAVAAPAPDLLVTGDGRHVAVRGGDGRMRVLRERAGDYVRGVLGEAAGIDGELGTIDDARDARCSRDLCLIDLIASDRRWRIAATRSMDFLPINTMTAICRESDIVISDRRLPRTCNPLWLKLDRAVLSHAGGVAIDLDSGNVSAANTPGHHPWKQPTRVGPAWRQSPWRARADPTGAVARRVTPSRPEPAKAESDASRTDR